MKIAAVISRVALTVCAAIALFYPTPATDNDIYVASLLVIAALERKP